MTYVRERCSARLPSQARHAPGTAYLQTTALVYIVTRDAISSRDWMTSPLILY